MTYPTREVMQTELAMLEDMLGAIEPDRVIERTAVEARRDRVRQDLERLGTDPTLMDLPPDDEVSQKDETLRVVLNGVLPERHRFEATFEERTIDGSIAAGVPIHELCALVARSARLRFRVTQFRQNAPRYLLTGIEPNAE